MPYINSGKLDNPIKGTVDTYASLPTPLASFENQLWFVEEGSGGLLNIINVYKYPVGLYTPNTAFTEWVLTPFNVKVAEDSTTLINIDNWTEFYNFAFDINIGDRLIFNQITYTNTTGNMSITSPDLDTTNWSYPALHATSLQFDTTKVIEAYSKGKISYDPNSLVHLLDTGINEVRINIGQEEVYLVYNDTLAIISNGKACYASGVDPIHDVLTVDLADNSSFFTSAQILGLATHDIQIGELGLITTRGIVRDFDTTGLSDGLTYLGTAGNLTSVKPLYPATRTILGARIKTGVSDGQFQVAINKADRRNASRSYTFTSATSPIGIHYRAGFYDWASTSVALTQASLTVSYGSLSVSKSAHIGIVPEAVGVVVGDGQVGLQVVGTLDGETGVQIASQTAIITDDITTLTTNTMIECVEKFSGQVSIELYVVSGTPTSYNLTFNYGFSKYEDLANIDATITAFECVWEAGANDTNFDVALMFHSAIGWTYASTGFVAGNGDICRKSVDQAIAGNLANFQSGSYKRSNLNQFIEGSAIQGVIIEVFTGANNSISSMDMHLSAFSEEIS